jgi:hypothetical protein
MARVFQHNTTYRAPHYQTPHSPGNYAMAFVTGDMRGHDHVKAAGDLYFVLGRYLARFLAKRV